MIFDIHDLVEAVFNKVGKIMYDFYNLTVPNDTIGCIWHADDFGFKGSTMISIEPLNKWLFPWLRLKNMLLPHINTANHSIFIAVDTKTIKSWTY